MPTVRAKIVATLDGREATASIAIADGNGLLPIADVARACFDAISILPFASCTSAHPLASAEFPATSLAEFLKSSGLTQAAFGKSIGISQSRVQQLLNGDPWPLDRCAQAERVSDGRLRCEDLRSDVLWIRDDAGKVVGYQVRIVEPEVQVA